MADQDIIVRYLGGCQWSEIFLFCNRKKMEDFGSMIGEREHKIIWSFYTSDLGKIRTFNLYKSNLSKKKLYKSKLVSVINMVKFLD